MTFIEDYGLPQRIDSSNCVDPNTKGLRAAGLVELISFEPIDPIQAPAPTKEPLPNDWNKRWLKGIPCSPPCYEGITPGITTVKEAVAILHNSPIIVETSIWRLDHNSGTIDWRVTGWDEVGSANFRTNDPKETITGIGVSIGPISLRLCAKSTTISKLIWNEIS